ncbi:MAG: sulfatase-like hydrolase/transferase [Bacteroidetes bacterium]|nr:sulfatase-like hydrolase/transferase [Bacteroidota bacterium]
MLFLQRIPRLLRWIFAVTFIFLGTMTLFRFIFYWVYNPIGKPFSGSAFIMGLRFDARVAAAVGLSILLLTFIPYLNPFRRNGAKKFWNVMIPFTFVIMVLVYAIDFYHYDYLHQRLNATILNYLQDAGISFNMMWQTYPLLRALLLLIAVALLARFTFGKLLNRYLYQDSFFKRRGVWMYVIAFLLLAQTIVGKIVVKPGQFPLRWSDAFTLSDDFKANLALNPFQSFFSTVVYRHSTYDIKKVKADYGVMANFLGVQHPDSVQLNYSRSFQPADSAANHPNIVLVICESFSAYKSSMYGNPLNTTPYFKSLCDNGVFFDRCFTPAYGTPRGVWATVTGIPDVESPGTASRNPSAVDQHTIINDFSNYNHFYFLGGDATWANIRGVLTNNINNLHLYEQYDFKASTIDVWGISDKNLFLEANNQLKQQDKPFFAIIQTADNHRPYTIPTEDEAAFKKVSYSKDSLQRYGFESNEELNAFRYTDFCYRQFMQAAQKEKYFDNTIFVFVGDHGIRGSAGDMFPKCWTEQGLTCEHVPLLFYAPKLLAPKRVHEVCSQVDILPSIATLAKIPYTNTTIGRNVFDSVPAAAQYQNVSLNNRYAFIIDHDVKSIGLISDQYYYLMNQKSGVEAMFSMTDNAPVPQNNSTDSIKKEMAKITNACYETARYMLLNNKKK